MNHLNISKQNPKLQFKKTTIAKLNDQLLSNKMRFLSKALNTVGTTVDCDF
jgi:hypothetical protein